MKKVMIVVGVFIVFVYFMMLNNHAKKDNSVRLQASSTTEDTIQKTEIKQEENKRNDDSVYEKNIELIKSYVNAVYKTDDEKSIYERLKGIVTDDLLKQYEQKDNVVSSGHHVTMLVKNAKYTASEDVAMAVFTLKTKTDHNESNQTYFLQLKIQDDFIHEVVRLATLEN